MLRDLIHDKIISGKTPLSEFFEPDTVVTWFGYIAAIYGDKGARDFYSALLNVEKDFQVTPVHDILGKSQPKLVLDDSDDESDDDYEEDSDDDEDDESDDDDEDEDEECEEEDAEVAIANAVMEAQMRKEKWMELMTPLAKEFAFKDVPADVLLKVMWQSMVDGGSLDTLYAMGRSLYNKSVNW